MNKKAKRVLIGVAALAVVGIVIKGVVGSSDEAPKVAVEKVAARSIVETVNASGKIYPEVEVKVSPDISGEITELTVQEGDSVRRGQILARIYADVYSSQRDQAAAMVAQSQATVSNSAAAMEALRAQLEQDRTTYNRNRELFEQKVISKAELEQFEVKLRTSEAQYKAARQNLRGLQAGVQGTRTQLVMANKNLGRATIVAPMDGIVSMLNVKKGERVVGTAQMAGTEMLRVADMSTLEVRVDVGENDVVKISIGDSADVEVDAYNNRKFKGIVTQIASSTKSAGPGAAAANDVTNYEVHIRLQPSSYADLLDPSRPKKFPFRPGMNASADIITRRIEGALSVPIEAVAARVRGGEESAEEARKKKRGENEAAEEELLEEAEGEDLEEVVFVVKEDASVERRVVRTGIQDMRYIEVLQGLKRGERVVVAPSTAVTKDLRSGKKVTVVAKDKLFETK